MTLSTYRARKSFIEAWEEQGKTIGRVADDSFGGLSVEELNPVSHKGNPDYWVINDEYLEFRLALMKGDKIEWNPDGSSQGLKKEHSLSNYSEEYSAKEKGWYVLGDEIRFTDSLANYRIAKKPDTSWIVDSGYCRLKTSGGIRKFNVEGDRVFATGVDMRGCSKIDFAMRFHKWEPIAGEVVWAWHNKALPVLGIYIKEEGMYVSIESTAVQFDNVLPYLGEEFWKEQ